MIKFNRLSHGAIVPMWIVTTQLHSTNLFQVRNSRARLVALWLIGFPTAVTGAFRYVVFLPWFMIVGLQSSGISTLDLFSMVTYMNWLKDLPDEASRNFDIFLVHHLVSKNIIDEMKNFIRISSPFADPTSSSLSKRSNGCQYVTWR